MRQAVEKPPKARLGYEHDEVTKAPNWHGLVTLDLLFNNLATGLFLVAATGELAMPGVFAGPARWAYPVALGLLTADLVCLVLDLGHPSRFHHMLRVFKPSSPMSLGTWCLTAYSLPLTVLAAIDVPTAVGLLPGDSAVLGVVHRWALILGLLPALGSALYKGVLFSTSSQPGWKEARWLGAYLVNSALMLGAAVLLVLSLLTGHDRAAALLRPALGVLVVLNLVPLGLLAVELRGALGRAYSRARLARVGALGVVGGLLAPLGLAMLGGGAGPMLLALALLLAGSLAIRHALVMLPHAAGRSESEVLHV